MNAHALGILELPRLLDLVAGFAGSAPFSDTASGSGSTAATSGSGSDLPRSGSGT